MRVADGILVDEAQASPGWDILRQLKDANVPAQVIVLSPAGTIETAVAAIKEGAADYLKKPSTPQELHAILRRFEPSSATAADPQPEGLAGGATRGFEGILGRCPAMRDVFALIQRVAPPKHRADARGKRNRKEMVARAIHRHSRRRDRPLLACDCTALAPTLLESELFGHVKGSFSGAIATKMGLFEVAHQGTLFLDEVANLSLETQGKLLRVLETRQVRKVGDTVERAVDIRLIATSNRNLAELVKAGAFRADLYYRLNVVPIWLPPLRDRHGDIPLLAAAFLQHFSRQMDVDVVGFSPKRCTRWSCIPGPATSAS